MKYTDYSSEYSIEQSSDIDNQCRNLSTTGNISDMITEIEKNQGVHYLKIVGRE